MNMNKIIFYFFLFFTWTKSGVDIFYKISSYLPFALLNNSTLMHLIEIAE